MIRLGEYQKLAVVKETDFGVYLGRDEENGGSVVLPFWRRIPLCITRIIKSISSIPPATPTLAAR